MTADLCALSSPPGTTSGEDTSRCRTIGHSWFDYDSTWRPQFGVPLDTCVANGVAQSDGTRYLNVMAGFWPATITSQRATT